MDSKADLIDPPRVSFRLWSRNRKGRSYRRKPARSHSDIIEPRRKPVCVDVLHVQPRLIIKMEFIRVSVVHQRCENQSCRRVMAGDGERCGFVPKGRIGIAIRSDKLERDFHDWILAGGTSLRHSR